MDTNKKLNRYQSLERLLGAHADLPRPERRTMEDLELASAIVTIVEIVNAEIPDQAIRDAASLAPMKVQNLLVWE